MILAWNGAFKRILPRLGVEAVGRAAGCSTRKLPVQWSACGKRAGFTVAFTQSVYWSFDPEYKIGLSDVHWVATQLRRHGGREAWQAAVKLCR